MFVNLIGITQKYNRKMANKTTWIAQKWGQIAAFFSTFFTPAQTLDKSHAATVRALSLLSRVLICVGAFSNYTFIIHTCSGFFFELFGDAWYMNAIFAHVIFVLCVACIDLCMGVFAHHATMSFVASVQQKSPTLALSGAILAFLAGLQCWGSMYFSSAGNSAVIAEKYEHRAPDNHAAALMRIDSTRRAALEGIRKSYSDRMKEASTKDAAELKRLTEQAAAITKNADLRIRQKLTGFMGTPWGVGEYNKAMEKHRNDSTKIMSQYHPTASNIAFQMNSDLEATRSNFATQEQSEKDEHYRKSENYNSTLAGVKLIFAKFTSWSSIAASLVIVLLVLMTVDFQRVSKSASNVAATNGGDFGGAAATKNNAQRSSRNSSGQTVGGLKSDCHTYFDRLNGAIDKGNLDSAKTNISHLLSALEEIKEHPQHASEKEAQEIVDGFLKQLYVKADANGWQVKNLNDLSKYY